MNTKITYLYRDASNYKEIEIVVVKGEINKRQIIACLDSDNDGFIPNQIGLQDLQTRMEAFPSDDDHVWHELIDCESTEKEPTIELTAEQLLKNFREAKGNWDTLGAMNRLGIK